MQTTTIRHTTPAVNRRHIREKNAFITKLRTAIDAENQILESIDGPTIFTNGPRQTNLLDRFTPAAPYHPRKSQVIDTFIRNIDASYKRNINRVVLGDMLREAESDLQEMEASVPVRTERIQKTLTIIYRNGVIKPNQFPAVINGYHWEIQTPYQTWGQIGQVGETIIYPGQTLGKVRLHFNDVNTQLISNSVDIRTVIKRQASAAKRQTYVFGRADPEFITRCKGVAGRILRLTEPRNANQPIAIANRFSMRVFQDRVSRLPTYLDMSVVDILTLCAYELSPRRQRQRDNNYIRMVEFCEPTIHLNPDALRRTLKRIAAGDDVTLQLGNAIQPVDSDTDYDTDNSVSSGRETDNDTNGETDNDTNSETDNDTNGETDNDTNGDEFDVSDRIIVTDGKWEGQTGRIDSITTLKYRLELDSGDTTATGKLPLVNKEDVQAVTVEDVGSDGESSELSEESSEEVVSDAESVTESVDEDAESSELSEESSEEVVSDAESMAESVDEDEFDTNARVIVTDGKWKGETGRIDSITDTKYRLELDSGNTTETGKLPLVKKEDVQAREESSEEEEDDIDVDLVGEDDYARLNYPALQSMAKDNQLFEYNVSDISSADDIREALRKRDAHTIERIQGAFDLYDKDGNGLISIDELKRGYDAIGREGALDALNENDGDGDGYLSFEEFKNWSLKTNAVQNWEDYEDDIVDSDAVDSDDDSDAVDDTGATGSEEDSIDKYDDLDHSALRAQAKEGKLSQYGVNGNSSADAIREALRRRDVGSAEVLPSDDNEESENDDATGSDEESSEIPSDEDSEEDSVDKYDDLDRSALRAQAKDGKLSQYGVNGNSSTDAIREALRRRDVGSAEVLSSDDNEESENDDATGSEEESSELPSDEDSEEDSVDKYDDLDYSALRAQAKDGKLSQYGVNGNSSADAIREALRRRDVGSAEVLIESSDDNEESENDDGPSSVSSLRDGDEEEEGDFYSDSGNDEMELAAVSAEYRKLNRKHPGDLSTMLANMSDDWASSEDELNFAEEEEEEIIKTSSGLEFAESSTVETDSDLDFAEDTSKSKSSGLEFAESSTVETDSDKEAVSSGLGWAESSDYD
jgi:transcription antitermination factor NusG